MISRRDLMAGAAGGLAAPLTFAASSEAASAASGDVCRWVDPFIGAGGHGHTYPGATTPFGMVQLSPDTSNNGWDSCSGYHLQDGSIMGFSHTHLSGTGCADLLDVLVVPATGPVKLSPGSLKTPTEGYRSRYDRDSERASPGYYAVDLTDSQVRAELTATPRVGLHRYHFPAGESGHLLIDLAHGEKDWWEKAPETRVKNASLRVIGNDTLVGSRTVFQWAPGRVIHFALKVSRPFRAADLYRNDVAVGGEAVQAEVGGLKAVLHFPDAGDAPLLVKVALSPVDVDGALANLAAEAPGWDFDLARRTARQAWESVLSRVEIEGATPAQARTFYTALYHCQVAPTLFSDVDGRTMGMDRQIHQLPTGRANFSTYSLWDTYRALHPLLTLIAPERVPNLVQALVEMARQSPAGPPVWPLQGIETGTMIGWHSAVVLAEAHAKGVKGIDYAGAWPAFRRLAFESDVHGLPEYRARGWIPSDQVDEAASRTLEYSYDDWAMAALADAAGDAESARALRARSRNYAHLFDKASTFIRPRLSNGDWATPFDPRALGHDTKKWRDFTECNAWEATFLNQHDLYAYMALFGGEKAFEAKLDTLFNMSSDLPADAPPDIAGMVGQYAHGNEPSHHVAYLYAYAGAHYKTQARVRMLLETEYSDRPDGLAGNEDCGQISAWYVMSALGLYAVDPVRPIYVFGSPLFRRVELSLPEGRRLSIEAPENSARNIYIQTVTWNGRPWTRSWISHSELIKGGRLVFHMGPSPNPGFGAAMADRPPSGVEAAI
jgi:predicted alpha-1,2-mannosidase